VAVALALLVAMAIATTRSWLRDTWALATAMCLTVVWLLVSKDFEGPVLVSISEHHGLVLADLPGFAAAAAACLGWLVGHRRSPARVTAEPV